MVKFCEFCRSPLVGDKVRNKYCNHSCAAKSSNGVAGRRKQPPKIWTCVGCGVRIIDNKHSRKFCSRDCQSKFKKRQLKNRIVLGGKVHHNTVRRYLLESRPHKCEMCGNTQWLSGPIPLIMDHIDGNSQNNNLANLRLVCGNCDMLLPTYKAKNMGKGRFNRRLRYREGKSY